MADREHRKAGVETRTNAVEAEEPAPSMWSAIGVHPGLLQRKLSRRRAQGSHVDGPDTGGEANAAAPASSGAPIPAAVRGKMEGSLGADFSGVRVHEGPQASAMGALAYAQGEQIYFAPGQYSPDTPAGQSLLGHELSHVVQQRAGRVAVPQGKGLPVSEDAALEREADEAGEKAAKGTPHPVAGRAHETRGGAAPVQRKIAIESKESPTEHKELPKDLPPAKPEAKLVLEGWASDPERVWKFPSWQEAIAQAEKNPKRPPDSTEKGAKAPAGASGGPVPAFAGGDAMASEANLVPTAAPAAATAAPSPSGEKEKEKEKEREEEKVAAPSAAAGGAKKNTKEDFSDYYQWAVEMVERASPKQLADWQCWYEGVKNIDVYRKNARVKDVAIATRKAQEKHEQKKLHDEDMKDPEKAQAYEDREKRRARRDFIRAMKLIADLDASEVKSPQFGSVGGGEVKMLKNQLAEIVEDPYKINQADYPVCGPATLMMGVAENRPDEFVRYVIDLVKTGKGTLGKLEVTPTKAVKDKELGTKNRKITAANWVALASLRSSENTAYGGIGRMSDSLNFFNNWHQGLAGSATESQLIDMYKKVGYTDVARHDKPSPMDMQMAGASLDECEFALMVNGDRVEAGEKDIDAKGNVLGVFNKANHWVRLASPIVRGPATISFSVWTWGKVQKLTMPVERLNNCVFGYIRAKKPKSPSADEKAGGAAPASASAAAGAMDSGGPGSAAAAAAAAGPAGAVSPGADAALPDAAKKPDPADPAR